jgi:hypothetical protein
MQLALFLLLIWVGTRFIYLFSFLFSTPDPDGASCFLISVSVILPPEENLQTSSKKSGIGQNLASDKFKKLASILSTLTTLWIPTG